VIRGPFLVDGAASSGIFAGATGDGEVVNRVGSPITISGKLKLHD
jgi:hypothetical protein